MFFLDKKPYRISRWLFSFPNEPKSGFEHAHISMLYKWKLCIVLISFVEFLFFVQRINKLRFLIYPNFKKKLQNSFFKTENCKYLKNLSYDFSIFFYILFHFVFQIRHQIFKNFDKRKFKIFKKDCENAAILITPCYHGNENF